jgi:hypothetical protein
MEISGTYLKDLSEIIQNDVNYDLKNIKYILSGCIDLSASSYVTGYTSGYTDLQTIYNNININYING